MSHFGPANPKFNNALYRAINASIVTVEQAYELTNADGIISSPENQRVVFEVSITTGEGEPDLQRTKDRATFLPAITGGDAKPAVITSTLPAPRRGSPCLASIWLSVDNLACPQSGKPPAKA